MTDLGWGVLLPAVALLVWWIGSRQGWISPHLLPPPGQVWETLDYFITDGELLPAIGVSLLRVLYGFIFGAAVGLTLGVAIGLSDLARDYLNPSFRAILYLPLLGWLPIFVAVLGVGETLKIALIAKAAFVPIVVNTYSSLRGLAPQLRDIARVYQLGFWQSLRHVVLPAAIPQIWSGIRYGLTLAWLVLAAVEFMTASEGVGYLMVTGQQLFQTDTVLVMVGVIGLIGFSLDRILAWTESRLLRWRPSGFAGGGSL